MKRSAFAAAAALAVSVLAAKVLKHGDEVAPLIFGPAAREAVEDARHVHLPEPDPVKAAELGAEAFSSDDGGAGKK